MTRTRASKPLALAAVALLSGAILLAWSMTWFTVRLADGTSPTGTLAVAGDVAAPALVPLALASLALVAALAIAGPAVRVVLAVILAFLGAGVAASAVVALADPLRAVAASVVSLTGLDGESAVDATVASIEASAWPIVTVVLGCLLAGTAIVVAMRTRGWAGPSARYDTPVSRAEEPPRGASTVSDWDALSDGDDPTGPPSAR
ncbi:Trp biosynthesis-associated membrane protein [Salinibacterium sp. SYSU T00001]|uniref:Trp biosynthesis-associated membrane protein n=1 Tax=Homoserinimonas sedimenticola TaxID=2986805 RepID=UPI002235BA29|nr:Trp biosynthesis-associated membrane protein [Salinibacterium sedimenticola]MCW4384364.1 Trp biosynthesis-associated membrane protein [Salinibacterium sedimenticola]